MLCADADAAEAALTRIKSGEQFGDVAADMSSCPSKDKGGDLGWFKKGQMVAEFEAACFENDPGTIVKVQTEFGWHVVREREGLVGSSRRRCRRCHRRHCCYKAIT